MFSNITKQLALNKQTEKWLLFYKSGLFFFSQTNGQVRFQFYLNENAVEHLEIFTFKPLSYMALSCQLQTTFLLQLKDFHLIDLNCLEQTFSYT